jgi:hypothetical protein
MRALIVLGVFLVGLGGAIVEGAPQNTAKTEIPGKGPCTNFPIRYQKIEERLAWFYGCMHTNPPTIAEVRAKIAALPETSRDALKAKDFPTQEALVAVAAYDVPLEVFPK